jgi:hypothetical protein
MPMSLLGFLKDLLSPAPPVPPTGYSRSISHKRDTKSRCDKNGYLRFKDSGKLLHRYWAEKKLGRKLESWEVVHHIDGNKRNNNPSNLQVCGWDDHDAIHRTNVLLYNSWHKPKSIQVI